jgi:hypothetical protein
MDYEENSELLEESEELEEQEQEEEVPESEEQVDEPESENIPLIWDDEDGNQQRVDLTYEELVEMYKYQNGPQLQEVSQYIKAVEPIIQHYNDSDLMKTIYRWRTEKYSEMEIKRGLKILFEKELADEKPPEFNTVDEKMEYLLNQKVEHVIKPLEQKLRATEEEVIRERIEKNNNGVFDSALAKHGYALGDLSQQDLLAINQTIQGLYPKADFSMTMFTPLQANVIIKDAIGRKGAKNANPAANAIRQGQAPRVTPGKNVRRETGGNVGPRVGVSQDERANNWTKMF